MEPLSLSDLTGRQSRTYAVREPTPELVRRRIHVAIARWEKPWRGGGPVELNGWIIVARDKNGRQIVRDNSTTETDPDPAILTELRDVLADFNASAEESWVVTGRRRVTLLNLLERSGFDVTGSFVEQNRATKKASALMQRKKSALMKGTRRRAPKESERPALWLPNSARTQGKGGAVTVSCDASSDTRSIGSTCFVADNGDYQLRTRRTPVSVDELELDAISHALKYSLRIGAESVVVESDSMAALEAVEHVRRSGARGRRFRGVSAGSLTRFDQAHREARKAHPVEIRRVLGHSGNPLNQAADQIAYLGLRASVHPRDAAEAPLNKGINQALKKARAALHK